MKPLKEFIKDILNRMDDAVCIICGNSIERIAYHFKYRLPPWNTPFMASLYFRDPFWGKPLEEYCSPVCSLIAYQRSI
jgi:hypothetical protein